MKYRPEVDGLRAVAVVPVILFHADFHWFRGGFVGVDVFFVISGYLIGSIILEHLRAGDFSLMDFYERRARRILPALFLVVAVCVPLAWITLSPLALKEFARSVAAVPIFSSNILFWRESGYFERASEFKPLLHTWSLAVEEQFYLLFPLFLAALWRWGRRLLVPALVLAALMSFALAEWASTRYASAAFFLLPSRGWELLCGVLVALRCIGAPEVPRGSQMAGLAGLALIALAVVLYDRDTPYPGIYAAVPVLGTCLVLLYARAGTFAHGLLSIRALVFPGLISYSAYLWHQPLFAFYRASDVAPVTTLSMLGLALLSFVLAWVTWKYVETPFRRGVSVPSRRIPVLALSFGALLVVFGVTGSVSNGFVGRYTGIKRDIAEAEFTGGSYVVRRFDARVNAPFDPADPATRVVLVGDSYAKDLINAVYEAGEDRAFQFSSFYIPAECGNLDVTADFSAHIETERGIDCSVFRRYGNDDLVARLQEADEVWLVSSWRDWQVQYLPETISSLETDYGLRVLVFGRKNFGYINIARLLHQPEAELRTRRNELAPYHVETNRHMKALLDPRHFVDVSWLLCRSETHCPVLTPDGALISYDGGHLTRAGAAELGRALLETQQTGLRVAASAR